ncbi:hypothetical protein PENTCL1PPCAC_7891, partial [Pristionchus entomophagus]
SIDRNERVAWPLHKRRQVEAARHAKRRDDHTDLITRLKVIFDLRTPESWRESLAADLPSLTARGQPWEPHRWMPFRAVNWIIRTLWAQLPAEKNKKVRCSLLRAGARMFTRPPFTYSALTETRLTTAAEATLDVLEQDELSTEERERSFGVLHEILDYRGGEQLGDRIINVSLSALERHRTTGTHSSRELRRLAGCMRYGIFSDYPSSTVGRVIDDEHAMPFVFDGIRWAEGREHVSLSLLLATILEYAPPTDRATLVTRHYTQLKEAFHLMRMRDFNEFLMHAEFAGIMVTTTTLLHRIWLGQQHDCAWHADDFLSRYTYDNYCQNALYLMESALDDGKRLQELLGYGFLSVAGHFASNQFDMNARRAATFRRILSLRPEWAHRFKEMTAEGSHGNLTADVGREIAEKPTNSSWYIIADSDNEDEL